MARRRDETPNASIIMPTPYGSVAIVWVPADRRPTIIRVLLSTPSSSAEDRVSHLYPTARAASCAEIDAVAHGMKRLLEGEPVDFSLGLVDLDPCGEFQRQVLRAEHQIPRGSVSTYGLIAAHLGKPKGARAVGNALATNPFPLIVPCHRAIRSDRSLGGYQGGIDMKRSLLGKEGISFDDRGRAEVSRLYYAS